MKIKNKSKAWRGKDIEVKRLSGLIISQGGLKYGNRTLVDDYLQDFQDLKIPALLNKDGAPIEDLYDDFIASRWIYPVDHSEFRDVADYILDGLQKERRGQSILDPESFHESDSKGFARYLHKFVNS